MAAEVSDLIAGLRSGALTLGAAAQQARDRTWARTRRPSTEDYAERAAQLDPPLPVPGSIDDLTAAFDRGELTWRQYRTLAGAVAESIDAEYEAQRERESRQESGQEPAE